MNKIKLRAIALTISLVLSASVMAESVTRNQFTSQKKSIASEYKLAKAKCDSFAGNASDICIAEAKGNRNVANAELKFNYKPSVKSRFGLSIAKADAEYAVTAEKCDDMAGKKKDVCVNKAKIVQIQQITDAKVEAKTMKANTGANKKAADINTSMTNQEPMEDDTDSAVTEIKPIESDGSDITPLEKDIFKDRIRIVA
jgi:hypothetical protein